MIDEEAPQGPPITELTRQQRRVLGVLVEKGFTTPEYYPLTLKALTAGCNQKSNRDPVTDYDPDRIYETIEELRELGLAAVVHTESGRTERFRHYMRQRFSFTEPQLAIVTELLLRGRQQLGELRSRASRMVPIEDQKTLRAELNGLLEQNVIQASGPLERRGIEVDHALYTEREGQKLQQVSSTAVETPAAAADSSTAAPPAVISEREPAVSPQLESEVQELRAEQRELRETIDGLKDEFRQLSDRRLMRRAVFAMLVVAFVFGGIGLRYFVAGAPVDTARKAAAGDQKPFGLKKRVPWTSSRLLGSPDPPSPYRLERVFQKLTFTNPVVLTNAPGTDRMFVLELAGKVVSFPRRGSANKADLAVDLKKEIPDMTRAYGLTFHPNFAQNRYCYLSYVTKPEIPDGTRVSRFVVSKTNPPTIDADSEKIIITWKSGGHNGACLKFGPEGYLYVSTGDGAGAFPPDTLNTGQRVDDLLASILRIDVDRPQKGKSYSIPADNPFVKHEGARGEVWSYGHRNPWKMSFDPKTGDLWVGDVGWEMWEMIYRVKKGDNYGWSVVEASQSVHPERKTGPTPIVPPTIAHAHTESRSITGGFVYRGKRLPELDGTYIYGDYVTGKIWGAKHNGKKITSIRELHDSTLQIICFGVDNRNELYVVTYDGTIHRLVKNQVEKTNFRFPRKLSETGLFHSTEDHKVAPGVIPYSVVAEPWMDGATAKRYLALPGKSTLGIHTDNNVQKGNLRGEWNYPENAILMKTIFLKTADKKTRRVETQILHRVGDQWKAYNYIWNDQQTDAVFLDGPAKEQTFVVPDGRKGKRRQTWHHASRTECIICHTTRGGSVYGFLPEQLDRDHDYGDVTDNQLRTLKHIAVFDKVPKGKRPRLIPPRFQLDEQKLQDAALSYLHVNCATCHRRGGGGTSRFELLAQKALKDKYLFNERPTQGTFGIPGAQVIAPGDPYRSILFYRMATIGRGRMPHFGSNVLDRHGLELIEFWIRSMKTDDKPTGAELAARRRWREDETRMEFLRILSRTPSHARAEKAIDGMLSTPSRALRLSSSVLTGRFNPRMRKLIIEKGSKHSDPQVRDLFEAFLPEEKRIKRLGTLVDVAAILARQGDVDRGRRLFFETKGVTCGNCHKIQGKGKEVGPDLSHIGKKLKRAEILESILHPSKKIETKYRLYLVETKRGKVHTGLLASQTDAVVTLKDAQGKLITIDAGDVESMVPQRKSMMPELLLKDMTLPQALDLLEYLHSLK
eukprot:g8440.t1